MKLTDSINSLKGIGKKREEIFVNNGIETVGDLLDIFPVSYQNRTQLILPEQATQDNVTILARVKKKGRIFSQGYKKTIFSVDLETENHQTVTANFFNQPYLINSFVPGESYYFYGRISEKNGRLRLNSPAFDHSDESESFLTINPIYPKIGSIQPALIKKLITSVLEEFSLQERIPEKYLERFNLVSLNSMYSGLHFPKSKEELQEARRRFKFNEGLKLNAGIISSHTESHSTDIIINNFPIVEDFVLNLPFELTHSQNFVLLDIFKDLESGKTMNRMIEGDVGSGKTILAVICAYLMAVNGLQTAYMAPTEILAQQHYQTFKKFLEPYGIKTALLTGSLKDKEASEIRDRLAAGEIQVIIGTHALIQENTAFYNLGLIVTDEQHRFGVKQRGQFGQKGEAHTLVMSATPIPRTLALTLYGDLDVSVIDELPSGRKKVFTYFYTFKKIKEIFHFIEKELNKGHQAFVVCPFVENSETMPDVISVEKAYQVISEYAKDRFTLDYLHGKLTVEERDQKIKDFESGKTQLLIATSIIEVGIDVPNVSVIAILSADRFGLSQLHQLRGRTGRSDIQSYCFLVSNNTSDTTVERMQTIVNCHDGREIALADLKLRGPGDYFGFRQHGFNNIRLLDPIRDKKIFDQTHEVAQQILSSPKAEDMLCKEFLIEQFEKDSQLISMN